MRVGRVRATGQRAVVCGPCWAAHGGSPDAEEIGPAPTATVPSWDPRDQRHWLAALERQDWVEEIRADGRANLLRVARLVALYASWQTLESRPTWARLLARTGLSERTVARWLQELRVRGWLAHLEHGSTPAHRPMVLAQLGEGNRAAVYGLRIPLTPQEALHRALEQLVMRLVEGLAERAAVADTATTAPERLPAVSATAPGVEPDSAIMDPAEGCPSHSRRAGRSIPPDPADRQRSGAAGLNGSPTGFGSGFRSGWVGGFSRASKPVDNSPSTPTDPPGKQDQKTALRAGSDKGSGPDWAITVPTSRFAMLIAADWLRRHRPFVFASCSRKLIRHLCRPYWQAGLCNRDIVHALDHRPGVFGQAAGVPIWCPEHLAAPPVFIRSRLAAWHAPDGAILPGHWTSRVTDAATTRAARQLIAARHGRTGAALLRPAEHTLSAARIADHGHTARPPASAAHRAAAKADAAARMRRRSGFRASARGAV